MGEQDARHRIRCYLGSGILSLLLPGFWYLVIKRANLANLDAVCPMIWPQYIA